MAASDPEVPDPRDGTGHFIPPPCWSPTEGCYYTAGFMGVPIAGSTPPPEARDLVPLVALPEEQVLLAKIVEFVDQQGGGIGINRHARKDGAREWIMAVEFGQEAPDSPMVGGASYGVGETLVEALRGVSGELGLEETA